MGGAVESFESRIPSMPPKEGLGMVKVFDWVDKQPQGMNYMGTIVQQQRDQERRDFVTERVAQMMPRK